MTVSGIIVRVVLLMLLWDVYEVSGDRPTNCSSKNTVVCRAFTNESFCDYADSIQPLEGDSHFLDHGTINFNSHRFMNSDDKTGVRLSWQPNGFIVFNKTVGYIMRVYKRKQSGGEVEEMCRYFEVFSRRRVDYWLVQDLFFTYTIPQLKGFNTQYVVSLKALPHSADVPAQNVSFTTYHNTKYVYPMNLTVDTPYPYAVTASFRRSSYRPEVDILYNHTHYVVSILHTEGGLMKTLSVEGKIIQPITVNRSTSQEYAAATFEDVLPGLYEIKVSPYKSDVSHCVSRTLCESQRDEAQSRELSNIYIKGVDYLPATLPVLRVDTSNLTVVLPVAPRRYHIVRYHLVIKSVNVTANFTRIVTSVAGSDTRWSSTVVHIQADEISNDHLLSPGNIIYVQVIPVVDSRICSTPGHCDGDGKGCKQCNQPTSNRITLDSEKTNPWAVSVFVPLTILVIISVAVVCMWRRRRQLKTRFFSIIRTGSQNSAAIPLRPVDPIPDPVIHTVHPPQPRSEPLVRVGITFTTSHRYHSEGYLPVAKTISAILEKFFCCQVETTMQERYTDIFRRNFDFIIVLCSDELLSTYQAMRKQQTLQHASNTSSDHNLVWLVRTKLKSVVMLAVLEREQETGAAELANSPDNHTVNVYRITEDLHKMAMAFCSGQMNAKGEIECERWAEYKQHQLRSQLSADLSNLRRMLREGRGDDNLSNSSLANLHVALQSSPANHPSDQPTHQVSAFPPYHSAQSRGAQASHDNHNQQEQPRPDQASIDRAWDVLNRQKAREQQLLFNNNRARELLERSGPVEPKEQAPVWHDRAEEAPVAHGRAEEYQYKGPAVINSGLTSMGSEIMPTILPHSKEKQYLQQSVPFQGGHPSMSIPVVPEGDRAVQTGDNLNNYVDVDDNASYRTEARSECELSDYQSTTDEAAEQTTPNNNYTNEPNNRTDNIADHYLGSDAQSPSINNNPYNLQHQYFQLGSNIETDSLSKGPSTTEVAQFSEQPTIVDTNSASNTQTNQLDTDLQTSGDVNNTTTERRVTGRYVT